MKKRIFLFFLLFSLALVPSAGAELISMGWKTAGDGLITYDSVSELYWLDITETVDYSYNDILGELAGGLFDGFRYATGLEVVGLQAQAVSLFPGYITGPPEIQTPEEWLLRDFVGVLEYFPQADVDVRSAGFCGR